jgi:hypothetical protein
MKPFPPLFLVAQIVLLATPAFANPIATEVLRAREVEGAHVQLTYGVDGKAPQIPAIPITFGIKSTTWKPLAISYSTNTGSGLKGVRAVQMCDCGVPLGQPLSYNVTVASTYDGKAVTLTSTLTLSGKVDAAVKDPPLFDGSAWHIPDPFEVQGLDCTVECLTSAPSATGGAMSTGGSTAATTELKNNDGACSMVQGSHPAVLAVLLLGTGLAFIARRKRGS